MADQSEKVYFSFRADYFEISERPNLKIILTPENGVFDLKMSTESEVSEPIW